LIYGRHTIESALREAYEAGRQKSIVLILVRVVAPHFVAGFETDGVVRRERVLKKK
jgi:hypothetical protein